MIGALSSARTPHLLRCQMVSCMAWLDQPENGAVALHLSGGSDEYLPRYHCQPPVMHQFKEWLAPIPQGQADSWFADYPLADLQIDAQSGGDILHALPNLISNRNTLLLALRLVFGLDFSWDDNPLETFGRRNRPQRTGKAIRRRLECDN